MRKKALRLFTFVLASVLLALLLSACSPKPSEPLEPSEPPKLYYLELTADEGGDIPAGMADVISGYYKEGERIHILCRSMPGFKFDRWTSSNGGQFDDEFRASTYFTMPAHDTVVTERTFPTKR